MNTALMTMPRLQFCNANGVPLAGGFVYTYAAGTTTPLATYQDSAGAAANSNPVVLDSGGFAAIWLGASAYKIIVQDVNGVTQWSADNVSAVSLPQLQGISSFTALTVTGNLTVGGDATLDGALTAATVTTTGTANVEGALTAASATISGNMGVTGTLTPGTLNVTGNAVVGGTLAVTGAASVASLSVGGSDIHAVITGLIPSLTSIAANLIVTDISKVGAWLIITFGSGSGSRIRLAIGSGSGAADSSSITLPSGFTSSQLIAGAWIDNVAATSGNQLSKFSCGITAGVISVSASDNSGHNFTPTCSWLGVAWQTGY